MASFRRILINPSDEFNRSGSGLSACDLKDTREWVFLIRRTGGRNSPAPSFVDHNIVDGRNDFDRFAFPPLQIRSFKLRGKHSVNVGA